MAITPRQFEQLQARVAGRRPAPSPVLTTVATSSASAGVVLGIDPSLRGTGYGVIQAGKPGPRALAHGTISCPAKWEHSRCLARIAQTIREIIQRHHPTSCAIEGLFFAQNLQTALIMGQARGAALAVLGEAGLDVYEIAPRKIKQAIVGYGAAQKLAVAKMVQRILQLSEIPAPDAADALAVAITHAHHSGMAALRVAK